MDPNQWVPADSLTLEAAAMEAVGSEKHCVVVAGPGAGKTELLAQRASFLLQTGKCPPPRRILAISFKKDASKNLAERVQRRCGADLASRFESRTYDAFAKSLLDRFRMALPEKYRPSQDYTISNNLRDDFHLVTSGLSGPRQIAALVTDRSRFLQDLVREHARVRLPFTFPRDTQPDTLDWIIPRLWRGLFDLTPSKLTFPIISRLAEYILRANPMILNALRATYSHVFLDEFQDTTAPQYDMVTTSFLGADVIVTAVGDTKQRIMGWAGALPASFETFERDFSAHRIDLIMNFRSAPHLVEIQHVLARRLEPKAVRAKPGKGSDRGECEIWLFSNHHQEAEMLAEKVHSWIQQEGLAPRDICILAKQRVEAYSAELIRHLSAKGIVARVEAELQDLLAEPVVQTLVSFLNLSLKGKSPTQWQQIVQLLLDAQGFVTDSAPSRVTDLESQLRDFLEQVEETLGIQAGAPPSESLINDVLNGILAFVGVDTYRRLYSQYEQGDYFNDLISRMGKALWDAHERTGSWGAALDDLVGLNAVPVMTVHKSKGLEYHTVVFVGLEDGAFWSFDQQADEDTAAFFVALSRAKHRAYFTFSGARNVGRGGTVTQQSRNLIAVLYSLLSEAGVPVVDHT